MLAAASAIPTYRIFLSSGDDAADLRERVLGLVYEAVNAQLIALSVDLRLDVDVWERTAAETNEPGEGTNDRFVRRALESNLTLALLLADLGPGTKEEIEATLEAGHDVKVLWFVPRRSKPESEVAEFLDSLTGRLYYDQTGYPEDDESWHGIVRVLLQLVLRGVAPEEQEILHEQR